jgi:large subunit ribosomal protein L6
VFDLVRIEEKATMSRKGKLPIPLPKGVEVKASDTEVSVKGPKGSLQQPLVPGLQVKVEGNQVVVSLKDENSDLGRFHGLYRTLIQNMVTGTAEGFEKRLEMIGVGYRAAVQGDLLDLQLGFSHPTKLPIPKGLTVKVDKNTLIIITGFDKHLVGQFAANVRSKRPPEPYQGKGIRYVGEYVRKKAGKAAAKK